MADDMKHAWGEVGDQFTALGEAVKNRKRSPGGTSGSSTSDDEADSGALKDAFGKVIAAVKELGEQASTIVKDAEIRSHTKDVAHSLNAALSATVDQIGEEVGSLVKRAKSGGRQGDDTQSPNPPEMQSPNPPETQSPNPPESLPPPTP
jgi:hypothetical protein